METVFVSEDRVCMKTEFMVVTELMILIQCRRACLDNVLRIVAVISEIWESV